MRAAGIGPREVDRFEPLVGDVHAGHDHVVLGRVQRRDDAVPILRHDLALHLHAAAELVREVDLEAIELAARRREVPRGIGPFGRDADLGPLFALRPGAARGHGHEREAKRQRLPNLHEIPPVNADCRSRRTPLFCRRRLPPRSIHCGAGQGRPQSRCQPAGAQFGSNRFWKRAVGAGAHGFGRARAVACHVEDCQELGSRSQARSRSPRS